METLAFIGATFFFLPIVIAIILPLFALVDIIKSDFEGNDKIIWVLIVLFLPILGSILYFLMGSTRKTRRY